jgi:IS5 family transposase
VDKRKEAKGPRWHVAMQPSKRRALDLNRKGDRLLEKAEQHKASVRAKVEHPFHVVNNRSGIARLATRAWRRTTVNCSPCSGWLSYALLARLGQCPCCGRASKRPLL